VRTEINVALTREAAEITGAEPPSELLRLLAQPDFGFGRQGRRPLAAENFANSVTERIQPVGLLNEAG